MIPLSVRFAARELRAGVRGFRIFLACLALGVAAIAAAQSTAEAFRAGLSSQAREILGGDLAVSVRQRHFTAAERATFERLGRVSYAIANRAMAEAASGERRLVELRGVGGDYPLAGRVAVQGAASLAEALAPAGDAAGAAVEPALLDRLGLKLGDRFLVGNKPFVVRAVLLQEPDRLSRGYALGPRVLARMEVVEQSGLTAPGLPFGETARIALKPDVPLSVGKSALAKAVGVSEGRIRDRNDAAPGIRRLIDQLEYFLSLVGLASLVAGGLGVFGAVSAYVDQRKPVIATLKALGADGALVRNIYVLQIAALASLGVAIGLALGAAAPLALGALVKNDLPVPALFGVYPAALVRATAFGLISAAAFSLAPLGRARATAPASLFRSHFSARVRLGPEITAAALAGLVLAALALAGAPTRLAGAATVGGVAAAFGLLWALGWSAAVLAARGRSGARGTWRIALANLAGPRSAARTAAPAIGLGVALLAAVVLIQSSLLREVAEVAPRTAPALVFTDIPSGQGATFDRTVAAAFASPLRRGAYLRAPFVTGRVTQVRGFPVKLSQIPPAERWAYDNDVNLSAIGPEPPNAGVVAGRWWPANYSGPPLVAVEVEVADAAKLKLGDRITLSVLGREIEARVAALRKIEFGAFGASFALVLTPNALTGARLSDVAIAKASPAQEAAVVRALGAHFPEVNVISVREQLQAAADLFSRLALAIRAAGAVVALAGLLVLAGAIAARAVARGREAAVLKVLGASRAQILGVYALEYGAVGVVAGVAGVALGYAAAWPVVVKIFQAHWSVDWPGLALLLLGAALLAGAGGLIAAFGALASRPAPALRSE
jgi:putative ABC transport system permease protein